MLSKRVRDLSSLSLGGFIGLLGPAFLFMAVFLIIPFLSLLELSFLSHSATQLWTYDITWENYLSISDGYYLGIFIRSLRIALVTTLVCAITGFPVAYFLARCSPFALSAGLFFLLMPLMVSTVVLAFGWIVVLGHDGLLNQLLAQFGMDRVRIIYTEAAVIIALIQLVLPLMVLPLMASIEGIGRELEEAAANLGCGTWGRIFKIILPLSVPGLISGAILCFAMAISVIVTPALLGGRHGRMIGNEIYDQVLTGLNWPLASALSVLLIVTILLLLGAAAYFVRLTGFERWRMRHA